MKNTRLLLSVAFLMTVIFIMSSSELYADLYKWVDKDGVVHYTDNPQNIPSHARESAEETELPGISTYEETGTSGGQDSVIDKDTVDHFQQTRESEEFKRGRKDASEKLAADISALESQINAKKDLIKSVEERKSHGLNPLRNRRIDESELELYERYKEELPEDESRLEEYKKTLKRLQK